MEARGLDYAESKTASLAHLGYSHASKKISKGPTAEVIVSAPALLHPDMSGSQLPGSRLASVASSARNAW